MKCYLGGCSRGALMAGLVLALSSIGTHALAVNIPLVNSGFDDDSLGNNQFNFTNSYNGWTEVDPGTGAAIQLTNVGPMNLHPSDLTAEHQSPNNVLYYQEYPTAVRVDQTSSHAISANDAYSLSVWAANDAPGGRFGGYAISLYADNGVSKTILKTVSGNDIADDVFVQKIVTLVDDVDLDFTPYIGQFIGVGLSSTGGTYVNGIGNTVPGIVFYDTVSLDVVPTVPEPTTTATIIAAALIGAGIFRSRSSRS